MGTHDREQFLTPGTAPQRLQTAVFGRTRNAARLRCRWYRHKSDQPTRVLVCNRSSQSGSDASNNAGTCWRQCLIRFAFCAEELTIAAQKAGLELEQLAGMSYDLRCWPFTD